MEKLMSILNKTGGLKPALSLLIAVAVLVGFAGCAEDDSPGVDSELTMADFVDRGWDNFEAGDYLAARADFQTALGRDAGLVDAYNGAGWASGRIIDGLNAAETYFNDCLARDPSKWDAVGGLTFIKLQSADLDSARLRAALDLGSQLLTAKPRWRFLHDSNLDYKDVLLALAAAWYVLGDYQASYDIVVGRLNPSFEADVSVPTGRRELFAEIERLRQIYG